MKGDILSSSAWKSNTRPKKILAIRFQALGDLMITLPYLLSLKEQEPQIIIHLLTRKEVCEIPKNLELFKKVIAIGGGRNAKAQFLYSLLTLPYLWWQHYDVVIDLQNHRISKIIRKLLATKAWSEFDRTSRRLAGERTRLTIDALQIAKTFLATSFRLRNQLSVEHLLKANGWNNTKSLIILNPAGAFTSRHWPIDNYIVFSRLWLASHPETQFLVLGLITLKQRTDLIKAALGDHLIDLTGLTTVAEAFALVKLSTLTLSEDSGLMHMSWIQGVPTIALFGSSPSYWSSPMGKWSRVFSSADLPCGDCFLKECKYGDVHCLTRVSSQRIVDEAEALLIS